MAIIASYDWESDTFTTRAVQSAIQEETPSIERVSQSHAAGTVAFDTAAWTTAVQVEAASMKQNAGPHVHARIDAATTLVLTNQVELGLAGHASVGSRRTAGLRYTVNGSCTCKDAQYNHPYCAHRIAVALLTRATKHLTAPVRVPDASPRAEYCSSCFVAFDLEEAAQPGEVCAVCALMQAATSPVEPPAPTLPLAIAPEHLVIIDGKTFVKYAGLLALAHARGLVSLTATWTYNDAGLSLAEATATFPFGTFTDAGDATPENVTKKVNRHFRRVALTRAKARALRDALNVDMCSVEELAE